MYRDFLAFLLASSMLVSAAADVSVRAEDGVVNPALQVAPVAEPPVVETMTDIEQGDQAEGPAAQIRYEDALKIFEERGTAGKAEETIAVLDETLNLNPDDELAYRIHILASRAYYWIAKHKKTNKEKMAVFEQAMAKAKAAQAINDDYADGYYWYALSFGKWCLANGIIASLTKKDELIAAAESAIDRDTQDGQSGATIDFYGPNRILGHLYFKLPGFAGGSHDEAITYTSEAYEQAPTHVLNVIYYAEVLNDGSKAEKAKAREILDELLKKDPVTLNPDRLPETIEEFEEARELRRDLGN